MQQQTISNNLTKVTHIKSFASGHPPESQKYFLIYPMNFDYCQQKKKKKIQFMNPTHDD